MQFRRIRWVGGPDALVHAVTRLPAGFVLESSLQANGLGRFTFAGLAPLGEFVYDVAAYRAGRRHPLTELEQWLETFAPQTQPGDEQWFPFTGGAVGFLAYEAGAAWMPKLEGLPMDERLPLMQFKAYDGVFVFDHENGSMHIVAHGWEEPAEHVLARLEAFAKQAQSVATEAELAPLQGLAPVSNFTDKAYQQAVERARQYIRRGDVYQVNLAQRFQLTLPEANPSELYQRFRLHTPAPYSACLSVRGGHLLSASPEQLLCRTGHRLTSRPIKGTRPRSGLLQADELQKADLAHSEKDQAELLMIVDLVRNDLGRIARSGTVDVSGLFNLETYPTVFHQTAQISALLAEGCGIAHCLEAIFPGGSITGAPKLRAMQIINELEQTPRGAYTGAIGWLDPNGNFEFNIAIRTATLIGNELSYHAGAGIVWDSDPEKEYAETLDKAAGFFRALGLSPNPMTRS